MLIRIDASFNQQLTIKRKGKRFLGGIRARSTSPDKGVPNKRIGAVNLPEKSERIVKIVEGCELEEPAMEEEEVFGVVKWGGSECLGVDLLELRHG